jgi:hypothetical protein
MNCDFQLTGDSNRRGEPEMVCSREACGRKVHSKSPPDRTFAVCRVPESAEWAAAQVANRLSDDEHRELFGESDPSLLGNKIKALTQSLGIPPCGGCGQRAAWLNKAHSWLREQFA